MMIHRIFLFALLVTLPAIALPIQSKTSTVTFDQCHQAIIHNQTRSLKKLIKRAPQMVNIANNEGQSLLLLAADHNQAIMTKLLIARGADVNMADNTGQTPLMAAAKNSNSRNLKFLLQAGANPSLKDKNGNTVLWYTLDMSDIEQWKSELIEIRKLENKNIYDKKASFLKASVPLFIYLSACTGAIFPPRLVFDNIGLILFGGGILTLYVGLPIYGIYSLGFHIFAKKSPYRKIHRKLLQAYKEKTHSFRLLIKKYQCDIHAINSQGRTVLFDAINKNLQNYVEVLLQNGASVNDRDHAGVSPLMLAAQQGSLESLQQLIKAGGNTTLISRTGKTALLYAAEHDYKEIVQILLDQPTSDVNYMNYQGNTALSLAQTNGHTLVANFLKERGTQETSLFYRLWKRFTFAITSLFG